MTGAQRLTLARLHIAGLRVQDGAFHFRAASMYVERRNAPSAREQLRLAQQRTAESVEPLLRALLETR